MMGFKILGQAQAHSVAYSNMAWDEHELTATNADTLVTVGMVGSSHVQLLVHAGGAGGGGRGCGLFLWDMNEWCYRQSE